MLELIDALLKGAESRGVSSPPDKDREEKVDAVLRSKFAGNASLPKDEQFAPSSDSAANFDYPFEFLGSGCSKQCCAACTL